MDPADHLFRREAGRMVATRTRIFGVHNLAMAEDVVQDAFCRALEVWKFQGMPENPSAWLMATAKHRALDILRRDRTARTLAPELAWLRETKSGLPVLDELFAAQAIRDDQLRMMFSCCHPKLPEDAQIALVLHILCGFSVSEIASAFLNGEAAVEKRITRAKKTLAASKTLFDLSGIEDFSRRLPVVQRTLYLLFNEGYHGSSPESAVRTDLCREAMRLTALLLAHPLGATPVTYALAALMCFHAARLPARLDAAGNLSSLFDQDRSRWDPELVSQGHGFLDLSASGTVLTSYHLEAAIAGVHTRALKNEDTDWKTIVSLYDRLMTINPSAVVALNRAIAVAQLEGAERGLQEVEAIAEKNRLSAYPFYWATLGELELRRENQTGARNHFKTALAFARNPMEQRFLEQRLLACDVPTVPVRIPTKYS
jgi:RNA polymerase sigma factor (sigma-70 family)